MAWLFGLSAECQSEAAAQAFSAYFLRGSPEIGGRQITLRGGINADHEGGHWATVYGNGLNEQGILSAADALIMTTFALYLYEILYDAPDFRFAHVGLEVDQFRTYSELLEDRAMFQIPSAAEDWAGLVVSNATWQALESPTLFTPFGVRARWIGYQGEVYIPLHTDSALQARHEALLRKVGG